MVFAFEFMNSISVPNTTKIGSLYNHHVWFVFGVKSEHVAVA